MDPIVSVVIPCYNHAHFLPHALDSVLGQTFSDWEAIVVDDGSTDATPAVVIEYNDSRINYVYQENQGLSAARNTGIRLAKGRYLAFLDADDEWEPGFLERCVGLLEANRSLAGVYTQSRLVDENGAALPMKSGPIVLPSAFRSRLLEGGFFTPNSVLLQASVLHTVGLFDRNLTSLEDWDLWIRISKHHRMQGIAEPLARYRVVSGSMSTNAARMHENRMAVLTKQFGPPGGEPTSWADEKRRAYGFAYRRTALSYLEQGQQDQGWGFLMQAVPVYPQLLERLDTFYELACGDQPRGYRGQAALLDLEARAAEILTRLGSFFDEAGPAMIALRRSAYSNTYLALGILSEQANCWSMARRYLLLALRENPRLVVRLPVLRRLLKVIFLSPRLVAVVRSQRQAH